MQIGIYLFAQRARCRARARARIGPRDLFAQADTKTWRARRM